jgi:putative glutamine amidotransferase
MTRRPIIGLTLDAEPPGGYSKLPWYALRQNYFAAVAEAGGLPVALPHEAPLAEAYLDAIDGLLVTGGAFDVDPALYGGGPAHETVVLKSGRTDFELAATRGALARDMPILGICGGEQLLAVALGGRLIQHIPDVVPGALPHEQPNPRTEPGHEVAIAEGTLLARIVGRPRMAVNSAHHQAVAAAGPASRVNATAPDGVIEGIESTAHRFALGVQWHPEYAVDAADPLILAAFVAACR